MKSRAGLTKASVLVVGMTLGLVGAQMVAAAPTHEVYEVEYPDGVQTFCSEGGLIDIMTAEVGLGMPGAPTSDQAVSDHAKERSDAVSDPEIPPALRELLRPSLDVDYERRHTSDRDEVVYYDVVSDGPADLEARLVVQNYPGDGWKIVNAVHCMSLLVTDMVIYDELAEQHYSPNERKSR